jgi:hypothetical protein
MTEIFVLSEVIAKKWIYLVLLVLISPVSWASSEYDPPWTQKSVWLEGSDLLITGIASNPKIEEARLAAYDHGLKELEAYLGPHKSSLSEIVTQMTYEVQNNQVFTVYRLLRFNLSNFRKNESELLAEEEEKKNELIHGVVQSTWSFGLGMSGSSTTMQQIDNALINYHLLDLSYGAKGNTYSNGVLSINIWNLSIGLPIYFSNVDKSPWTLFIEPGIKGSLANFSFQDSTGSTTSSVIKLQLGVMTNLGVQIRLSSGGTSGFALRPYIGGYYSILNGINVNSQFSYQGGLSVNWEFFSK